MSGIIGSKLNIRGSGLVGSLGTDGQHMLSSGAGVSNVFETVSAGGITEADNWRLTTGFAGDADPIDDNWERSDTAGQGNLGTGLTESSGVFSFPSTGWWDITFTAQWGFNGATFYSKGLIVATTDNSTYANLASSYTGQFDNGGGVSYSYVHASTLFDVDDITNCKVKFSIAEWAGQFTIVGSSTENTTHARFIRLGDT